MKVLKVKNYWFKDSDLRLDAAYHLSDGTITNHKLKSCPYKTLNLQQCAKNIFKGNIFKRVYVDNETNGFPFLTASDMMKAELEGGKYISRKYSDVDHLKLKKGWILVSRSGTLGNTVYTNEDFERFIGTDDLIRIEPDNSKLLPGFLYAYLSSKFGYGLLTQSGYGGVVQHIEPHHIENLPVPIFPEEKQKQIDQLIGEASELRVKANKLLEESENDFIHFNALDTLDQRLTDKSENALSIGFVKNIKDLSSTSLKARNYSIRAKKIIDLLDKKEGRVLKEYLEKPFRMGARASFKRINSDNFIGHNLVSQGDIHVQNPKKFKQVRIVNSNSSDFAQRKTVIIPSAGTLGENEIFTRPLLVRNNFEGFLLSEVIGKFICKTEEDAAYLYIFLSSKPMFRVLRAMVYGTNLLYPNWELLQSIRVPIANHDMKKKISDKVIQAFDMRGAANSKENEAIALIEKEIDLWQVS